MTFLIAKITMIDLFAFEPIIHDEFVFLQNRQGEKFSFLIAPHIHRSLIDFVSNSATSFFFFFLNLA